MGETGARGCPVLNLTRNRVLRVKASSLEHEGAFLRLQSGRLCGTGITTWTALFELRKQGLYFIGLGVFKVKGVALTGVR